MSFGYDLIEVLGLSGGQSSKAEVINDKEIWSLESLNPLFPGMICPGGIKASDHFNEFDKKAIVSFTAGLMTQGLCYVGFTNSRRSADKDMFLFLDEQTGS